jgi:hypothetical protein
MNRILFLLGGACAFLGLSSLAAAPESGVAFKRTKDPEYRAGCEVNLARISDALRQYREKHNQFPNWLSDLVPEFIHNREVLVCPYVRATGRLFEWRQKLNPQPGQDRLTYYYYEFCLEKYPRVAPTNSGKTYRDYKAAQRKLLGEVVPIVRCLAHSPVLNLACNGLVFEHLGTMDKPDMEYWEENFAHLYPHLLLQPDEAFATLRASQPPHSEKAVPAMLIEGSRILDLSPYFNFILHDYPPAALPTNNLSALPKGLQKWDGVTFDVRGVIHLTRGSRNLPFPSSVGDIVVTQACSKIHLLHGFVFSEPPKGDLSRVAIRFDGGQEHSVVLSHTGRHAMPGRESPSRTDTLVWQAALEFKDLKVRTVCLYHTSTLNPHPDVPVANLNFSSAMTEAAPFLLAVTLE